MPDAPPRLDYARTPADKELLAVVRYRFWLVRTIVLYFAAMFPLMLLDQWVGLNLVWLLLSLYLFVIATTVLLATALYGWIGAVAVGVVIFFPIMNLILVGTTMMDANAYLRKHGLRPTWAGPRVRDL